VILAVSPKALWIKSPASILQGQFNPDMSALPACTFTCNPQLSCSRKNVHPMRRGKSLWPLRGREPTNDPCR
jgi:hypothetical protein